MTESIFFPGNSTRHVVASLNKLVNIFLKTGDWNIRNWKQWENIYTLISCFLQSSPPETLGELEFVEEQIPQVKLGLITSQCGTGGPIFITQDSPKYFTFGSERALELCIYCHYF